MEATKFFLSDNTYFNIDFVSDRKYWFVRTNGGEYYTEYFNEEFIAVGLNKFKDIDFITRAEADPSYKRALYEKIKSLVTDGSDKVVKPGLIISQLKRFMIEMSIGDIVLIPSENSQYIYLLVRLLVELKSLMRLSLKMMLAPILSVEMYDG